MKITKAKLLGIGIGLSLGAIVGGMILGVNRGRASRGVVVADV